jgi:ABC-type nickel/cobalt efflux system permease component RcnA
VTARILSRLAVLAGIACAAGVLAAGPAEAHPLGNATVNHYDGLTLSPDRIEDHAVEDIAEIPTFQRRSGIDSDHDGVLSAADSSAYATRQCASMAGGNHLTVGGTSVAWRVTSAAYTEQAGAIGGLTVGRLVCDLRAGSDLSSGATVALTDNWDGAGIGWHEITAVANGVSLRDSAVPPASISDELRSYPNDLLSSPLDVRSTTLDVVADAGGSTYAKVKDLPVAGFAVRELNRLSTGFNDLVGRKNMSAGVGALALLLSVVLGAGHAFLPGHGKTVMAAYLVGRRGRLRDVATVGATVTITHTAGVLVLGLLIALGSQFATVVVEQDLAIVSGGLVALVGLGLLVSAVRRRRAETPSVEAAAVHQHADRAPARTLVLHGNGGPADHPHAHPHPHAHDRPHSYAPRDTGFSRGGLVGLGAAGGLVPSPSALLVLLAAVTAGRTVFGVGLVLAYGLGMALALCAAGLLVVRLQDRLTGLLAGRNLAGLNWVAAAMPVLTASLVLVVGLGLMARAISGSV